MLPTARIAACLEVFAEWEYTPPIFGSRRMMFGPPHTTKGASMSRLLATLLGSFVIMMLAAGQSPAAEQTTEKSRMLRHVVLFKFKDTSTEADVARIVAAFRGLPSKIEEIAAFEWGTDVSPEGKSQGLTHCFLVTFKSEADRDAYLPHPAHKEFVAIVGPHVDKVCVVDFWSHD